MTTLTCPALPCPRNHTCHVAVPLTAACPTLLCSFCWLTLCLYISFFLFSANFTFCGPVTVLSPSLLLDVWLSSPQVPLVAARTTSLWPLQWHAPCHPSHYPSEV